jgi:hypothetical protein
MMKVMFSRLIGALAYGNWAVAAAAWGYGFALEKTLGTPESGYPLLLFFGTYAGYAYMHLLSARKFAQADGHPVREYTRKNAGFIAISGAASALLALWYFTRSQVPFKGFAPALLPLVFLYPSLGPKFEGLRSVKRLKFPLVVSVWTLLVAVLPLYAWGHGFPAVARLAMVLSVALWIMGTALMFDLRDIQTDSPGLSWAQRLGFGRSIALIRGAYSLAALGFIALWIAHPASAFGSGAGIASLLVALLLCRLYERNHNPLTISFAIEIMPAFWALMIAANEWARQSFYF